MALPQAGGSTLPINRVAIAGTSVYHRYLVQNTAPITDRVAVSSNRRWHNELDKIYFQLEWVNDRVAVTVTCYIDIYLVPDNVQDTEPYASYQVLMPVSTVAVPGMRSFPIGGLPFYGSCEYFVRMESNNTVPVQVRLWSAPELWYSFRQIVPIAWTPHP
jgi:hypothetical protein